MYILAIPVVLTGVVSVFSAASKVFKREKPPSSAATTAEEARKLSVLMQ